jgi:hypothetical protein
MVKITKRLTNPIALLPEEEPSPQTTTYNGIEITATNAKQLVIPALTMAMELGWGKE